MRFNVLTSVAPKGPQGVRRGPQGNVFRRRLEYEHNKNGIWV